MRRFKGFVTAGIFPALSISGILAFSIVAAAPVAAQSSGELTARDLMSKLSWRSIGPYIGGRVVAVTGVPGNANLFYAGTVGGGIWKSTDDGMEWENISDGKLAGPSASIGAIAAAPSDPSVLYAGTGEDDIRNDMIPGDGVFRSSDAGKTWEYAGLRETHSISRIMVSPKDPNVVYASSMGHVFAPDPNRGVFKSTDGGKSWNKILFVDDKTGAIDLILDSSHPDVLYATMWQAQRSAWGLTSGGPGSGLYKTTDGGEHWTNLTRNPGLPQGVLGRIGITLVASHPDTLYAIVQAADGGVFRSDDGGGTWKRVNDEMKLRQRGFYFMTVFADPKDPNTVYAPQVDALWVSRDGGKSFTKLHTPQFDNHTLWINPDNTRLLLEGNDGGATVSTDGGKTWSTENNQPTGPFYHVNLDDQFPFHIYGAEQDESSYDGPSATASGDIPLGDWKAVTTNESSFVVPQPGDPDITYSSGYFTAFVKENLRTEQMQSVSPWPLFQDGASSAEQKDRFGWTHPILFSPANPKQLFTSAQYVFRSDDDGLSWTRISPDLTRNEPGTEAASGGPIDLDQSGAEIYPEVYSLAVSPLDGNLLWAGSDDGLVHVTTDGGQTWQLVTPPGLPDCVISSIEPSHTSRETAYLTAWRYMWDDFRPYVFETTDLGKHWSAISDGLPDNEFAFTIRQDPHDANLLFLGTFGTVYVSFDSGAHWQPLTLNLPPAEVRDIAISTREGKVVAATHGRSFWVLDNLALLEQLTDKPEVAKDAGYVFAPEKAWLTHAYGEATPEFRDPESGDNPPFGATVFFHIAAGYDGTTPATLTFEDAQGKVVRSFTLHLKTEKEKQEEAAEKGENPPDHTLDSAIEQRQEAEERLTAIEPGMNSFQWDLRYPPAVEVNGYHAPWAAGGLAYSTDGPFILPGRYAVVLDVGGQQTRQTFDVALDPRLHATQEDLAAELALTRQIQDDMNALNRDLNQALAARDKLEQLVSSTLAPQPASTRDALKAAIDALVQMNIRSSEGDMLHEARLHEWLGYLASDVEIAWAHPNAAHYAVFQELDNQAKAAEQKLESLTAQAGQETH
jgi:photosystem II stability/assembly factor-like uncharacterized protein